MTTPPSGEFAAAPPATVARRVQGIVSFLGGTSRAGHWAVPPHLRVATVLGNVQLDLRDAIVPPGGAVIEVAAVLAAVEIIAPPGLRVECTGEALVGSFTVSTAGGGAPVPEAQPTGPLVRITGNAYVAAVTVWVCGPGEHPEDRQRR